MIGHCNIAAAPPELAKPAREVRKVRARQDEVVGNAHPGAIGGSQGLLLTPRDSGTEIKPLGGPTIQ